MVPLVRSLRPGGHTTLASALSFTSGLKLTRFELCNSIPSYPRYTNNLGSSIIAGFGKGGNDKGGDSSGLVSIVPAAHLLYTGWTFLDENNRVNKIYATFESSKIPHRLEEDYIDRPAMKELVKETLTTCPAQYDVIVGNIGTGKSTLVREVASEIPGVIYIAITGRSTENGSTVRESFSNAFAAALNWKVPYTPWNEVIWGVRRKKLFDYNDSRVKFDAVFDDFQKAAAKFKAEHGCVAVLVIDDINIIAMENPTFMLELQRMAKYTADMRLYKMVFVSSGGVAPDQITGGFQIGSHHRSHSSDHYRIGNLTTTEARSTFKNTSNTQIFLKRSLIFADSALYRSILSIGLLRIMTKIVSESLSKNTSRNRGPRHCPYFGKELMASARAVPLPLLNRSSSMALLTPSNTVDSALIEIRDQLIAENVFVVGGDRLIYFPNQYTKDAVRDDLNQRSWSGLG
ncbi:hypothetical protein K440DRAFT_673711 [Wilcoxina mikolae CBS 423.85]|nr:hypothetical protein K440DRAFT_673711 [Wilcoxina mikolae CBS 423.85]